MKPSVFWKSIAVALISGLAVSVVAQNDKSPPTKRRARQRTPAQERAAERRTQQQRAASKRRAEQRVSKPRPGRRRAANPAAPQGLQRKPRVERPVLTEAELDLTGPRIVFEIVSGEEEWGEIVIALDEVHAPRTVANFLRYVDEGFYNGTVFQRVIRDFIIQGGGYVSATEPKRSGLHSPVRSEARNGLRNLRGTIAMARRRDPQSATSQFFINVVDNPGVDADSPRGDGWGYCVFGKVVEGMSVIDRIQQVETRPGATPGVDMSPSLPIEPPMIQRAYRVIGEPEELPPEAGSPEGIESLELDEDAPDAEEYEDEEMPVDDPEAEGAQDEESGAEPRDPNDPSDTPRRTD